MDIIEAFATKKRGRLALPLERLRYHVLNVIRDATALRFCGGPVIVTVNEEIVNKQVWVGTPMQFGNEIKQNMANVFVQAPPTAPCTPSPWTTAAICRPRHLRSNHAAKNGSKRKHDHLLKVFAGGH